jgi:hypothetical protein
MGTVRKYVGNITGQNQADAYEKAGKTQAASAKEAQQKLSDMYSGIMGTGQLQQYQTTGANANQQLGNNLSKGFTFDNKDPSYQWRLNQGADTLSAQSSAMGNLGSGNLGAALTEYGQNSASQEYSNAFNRWASQNQMLQNLSNTGQQQGQFMAGLGMESAGAQGNLGMMGAGALAQGNVNAANVSAAGTNNILGMAAQGMPQMLGDSGLLSQGLFALFG